LREVIGVDQPNTLPDPRQDLMHCDHRCREFRAILGTGIRAGEGALMSCIPGLSAASPMVSAMVLLAAMTLVGCGGTDRVAADEQGRSASQPDRAVPTASTMRVDDALHLTDRELESLRHHVRSQAEAALPTT